MSKLVTLSRLTIFLPRQILAFFPAVNKKLSGSQDRATIAHFVSLFRLLLMSLRCQSESIRWAMDSPPAQIYDMRVIIVVLGLVTQQALLFANPIVSDLLGARVDDEATLT